MISANELRRGNKFVYGKDDIPGELLWMTFDREHGLLINGQIPESHLNPIPLTPEILIAAGFEKAEYEKREQWLGPTLIRYQRTTEYKLGIIKSESYDFYTYEDSVCLVRIDYLHQLQNLYFALTGTELKINLQKQL